MENIKPLKGGSMLEIHIQCIQLWGRSALHQGWQRTEGPHHTLKLLETHYEQKTYIHLNISIYIYIYIYICIYIYIYIHSYIRMCLVVFASLVNVSTSVLLCLGHSAGLQHPTRGSCNVKGTGRLYHIILPSRNHYRIQHARTENCDQI